MLLRVPKNSGGARITTAAVTAAITGTTIMLEYHPDAYIKFIILEGTGRIFRNDRVGESVLLHAGQMLIVNPNGVGMPDPVDVDLKRLLSTSLLINGFPTLPSENLIAQAEKSQLEKLGGGELVSTNLVIFGRGTAVTLLDPTYVNQLDQANANESRRNSPSPTVQPTGTPTPTATPSGTPTPTPTISPSVTPTPTVSPSPTPTPSDKYGTPPVIKSPNPYIITNGTVINTDPKITTNGQTDPGKIYRGPADDGEPSTYLFGSTSSFDTGSGFNTHFSDVANTPMAVFKFSSLVLSGDPTIQLGTGGVTNLALISVGDITSGTSQATFTYDGIESLLLATQGGNNTRGSNITFQDIPSLFLYARGADSVLTFDPLVQGSSDLVLLSEGNIVLDSFTITETNPKGDSLNLFIDANADLFANDLLTATLDNAGNDLSGSAEISINAGGTVTANGDGGGVNLTISNNTSGSIGGDATVDLVAGGAVAVDSLQVTIDNSEGGNIDGSASITFDFGSGINIANDIVLLIIALREAPSRGTPRSMSPPTLSPPAVYSRR